MVVVVARANGWPACTQGEVGGGCLHAMGGGGCNRPVSRGGVPAPLKMKEKKKGK